MPFPWTTPVRSDSLHESFMTKFKSIWIWIFPCDFFFYKNWNHLYHSKLLLTCNSFFLIHEDQNRSSHNFALCLQVLQCAPQEQQVQQRCISAWHMICSEILSCESCAAFSLCIPMPQNKAWCSCKSTGKHTGKKISVCCNTEEQKTVLNVGRDLQTIVVHWISPKAHMMTLWES